MPAPRHSSTSIMANHCRCFGHAFGYAKIYTTVVMPISTMTVARVRNPSTRKIGATISIASAMPAATSGGNSGTRWVADP